MTDLTADSTVFSPEDEQFMRAALAEAEAAAAAGDVPVGAVVVCGGTILSAGRNRREENKNALHHAEILAIDAACAARGGWRLSDCTLYVTLEPCPMCAGAILAARFARVVYGAPDRVAGAFGTVLDLRDYPLGVPKYLVSGGLFANESAALLRAFFSRRR